MPNIQTLDLKEGFGKFVLEPLEKGYGQTIGNALRRVLLSSIPGAAVTAIRVEKVFHEFSSIPGVKEDATELILNLKDIVIRIDTEIAGLQEQLLRLNVNGTGKVTAADIECPDGVEVINPEAYIATISDPDASLKMELFVSRNSGYMLPDKHENHKGIIGLLPVGSQFTPVTNANFTVEQTRVGTQTDFERLVIDVSTNGSVTPNDCVSQAAQILDKYFKQFFTLGALDPHLNIQEAPADEEETQNLPDLNIEELGFSQRTYNCLKRAVITNLKQLAQTTETDISGIRGFGKKSLNEVRDKLAEYGVALKGPSGVYRFDSHLDDDEDDLDL